MRPHRPTPRRIAALAVLALGALLALTACDSALEPQTVEITGVNYAFEGVPDALAVGSDLTFANTSDDEVHELVLVRIPDDEDRPVSELVELPPDELLPLLGPGLVGVSVAPPGADGTVVEGDLALDAPGRYALVCLVPTGADPDEFMAAAAESEGPPDVEGGPPHTAQGMFAELTVEE